MGEPGQRGMGQLVRVRLRECQDSSVLFHGSCGQHPPSPPPPPPLACISHPYSHAADYPAAWPYTTTLEKLHVPSDWMLFEQRYFGPVLHWGLSCECIRVVTTELRLLSYESVMTKSCTSFSMISCFRRGMGQCYSNNLRLGCGFHRALRCWNDTMLRNWYFVTIQLWCFRLVINVFSCNCVFGCRCPFASLMHCQQASPDLATLWQKKRQTNNNPHPRKQS